MNGAKFLKRVLKGEKLILTELAEVCDMHYAAFIRWKKYEHISPTMKTMDKIAKGLKMKPSQLIKRYWER